MLSTSLLLCQDTSVVRQGTLFESSCHLLLF